MSMRAVCFFTIFSLWSVLLGHTETNDVEIVAGTVTFISSRSIYVQCDIDDSIREGDVIRAGADRDDLFPATVRSVSPRKLVLEYSPLLGEPVLGTTFYIEVPVNVPEPSGKELPAGEGKETSEKAVSPPIPFSGRISTQYFRYRGDTGSIEYDQPSMYMDMRLGGNERLPVELRLRVRTRLQRELTLPDGRETREERTDRLYDLSVAYGSRDESQYLGIGRMRTVGMPGMGGVDGIVYEHDLGKAFRAGVFYGVAPELENFIGDNSDVKHGGFLRWESDFQSSMRASATVSYIGRSDGDGGREQLLFIGHDLRAGHTFSLMQEAVVNVNTGGTGRNAEALRNFRSYFRYAPKNNITVSGSYYAYLVREYRDLDSGLDPVNDLRYVQNHTFRPSVTVDLPAKVRLGGDVLVGQNNMREIALLSEALHVSQPDLFRSGIAGSVSLIFTDRDFTRGRHLVVNLSRNIASGLRFNLSGSAASYENPHQTLASTQRLRSGLYHSIGRRYHYSVQYTRAWGEAVSSNQLFVEAGIRFSRGER